MTELPSVQEQQEQIRKEFPLFGKVTGLQLIIRSEPAPESKKLGWVRLGSVLHLKNEKRKSSTCASGWYPLYPKGWVCSGEGVEVYKKTPNSSGADADLALPYPYYFVKEPLVPEYHRLPSRDEQRDVRDFLRHYFEIKERDDKKAYQILIGASESKPPKPLVMHRALERGFFLAAAGEEVRAFRRFVQTVRGRYVKKSQLLHSDGSDFVGQVISKANPLPVAWVVRATAPRKKIEKQDGTIKFVLDPDAETLPRLAVVRWVRKKNFGGQFMHELEGERFVRHWKIAVAEKTTAPKGIQKETPWVHVDLSSQTLVLYRGNIPVYATLVSTGLPEFPTPEGQFSIRSKHVTATMSNIGPDVDERYNIEDVPWTQYFKGSIALHGAFWHERFGLMRSHGCVNIAPKDAKVVFEHTWPALPPGWHGVSTDRTGFKSSIVKITR